MTNNLEGLKLLIINQQAFGGQGPEGVPSWDRRGGEPRYEASGVVLKARAKRAPYLDALQSLKARAKRAPYLDALQSQKLFANDS